MIRLGDLKTEYTWIDAGVAFMGTITDPGQEQIIRSVLYHVTEVAKNTDKALTS